MTSPQVEDGFTKIANEILEAICRTNFNSYQSRLLWAVIRKTYGFGKTEDWISNSQLSNLTRLRKQHISRAKAELVHRRILVTSSGYKIKFNKDYSQWRELPSQVTQKLVTSLGSGVTSLGEHKRNLYKKQVSKDTLDQPVDRMVYKNCREHQHDGSIQKKPYPEDFLRFWELYPRPVGKKKAFMRWKKLTPEEKAKSIEVLPTHARSEQWTRERGRFIPHPETWLNQGRWDDEIEAPMTDDEKIEAEFNTKIISSV